MELKNAMAGTLESGDILIQIAPSDVDGLHIELDSTVAYQFGEQIKKVIINRALSTALSRHALPLLLCARLALTCGLNHFMNLTKSRNNGKIKKNNDVCSR